MKMYLIDKLIWCFALIKWVNKNPTELISLLFSTSVGIGTLSYLHV